MAKGAKAAAAAAAAEAAAAAAAKASSSVPPNIAHGVRVTLGFFIVYYAFLFAQGTLKRKLRAYYSAQGKKVRRLETINSHTFPVGIVCAFLRWLRSVFFKMNLESERVRLVVVVCTCFRRMPDTSQSLLPMRYYGSVIC